MRIVGLIFVDMNHMIYRISGQGLTGANHCVGTTCSLRAAGVSKGVQVGIQVAS